MCNFLALQLVNALTGAYGVVMHFYNPNQKVTDQSPSSVRTSTCFTSQSPLAITEIDSPNLSNLGSPDIMVPPQFPLFMMTLFIVTVSLIALTLILGYVYPNVV